MLKQINDVLLSLEKEVMEMLIENTPIDKDILYEQFIKASIIDRDFTEAGFFTHFSVPNNVRKHSKALKSPIRGVYAKISGLDIGVSFLLFLSDGVIDTLECYEWDEVDFPEEITEYQLSYDSSILNP